MASTLKVDNIIATDGTTAPITLSGDTATLSGTGVTFPSGHVIQMQHFLHEPSSIVVQDGGNAFLATGLVKAITPKVSGSKIIIQCSPNVRADGGAEKAVGLRMYYSTDGTNFSQLHAKYHAYVMTNGADTNVGLMTVDDGTGTSIVAGTERTYKLYINSPNSSTGRYPGLNYGTSTQTGLILWEVMS